MNTPKKIVSAVVLEKTMARLRRQKKIIAFTNGCFDILHFGHVSYLQKAKKNDRVLVVGLNSDRSVRQIKGPTRPINSQAHRAAVLAALSCVDYVTIFDEPTPYRLIAAVKPDVLVKGADWKGKEIVGSDIVKANGGRVELIGYVQGFSTTRMIENIKRSG